MSKKVSTYSAHQDRHSRRHVPRAPGRVARTYSVTWKGGYEPVEGGYEDAVALQAQLRAGVTERRPRSQTRRRSRKSRRLARLEAQAGRGHGGRLPRHHRQSADPGVRGSKHRLDHRGRSGRTHHLDGEGGSGVHVHPEIPPAVVLDPRLRGSEGTPQGQPLVAPDAGRLPRSRREEGSLRVVGRSSCASDRVCAEHGQRDRSPGTTGRASSPRLSTADCGGARFSDCAGKT